LKFLTLLGIFSLVAGTAWSAEAMRPADFEHEEPKRRLANRIEFPEMTRDATVMILCFSQIAKSGKMKETGCFTKDNFDAPFAAAIMKAAKKSTLNPAIIDGDKRMIYLQFRVEFIAKGEDRDIKLYLNPGYTENVDAYGPDHVAAQRVIGKEPWQGICPQRAKYLVAVRAFVGEDGRPENPSLERISGIMPTSDCQNAIKETILQSLFTPTMADGYPVPSAFIETFSN
jgi:hypothetical protein